MHLRFAALFTAWTKAGWRNASKLWRSVIWSRELILRVCGRGYILNVECNFLSFYTLRNGKMIRQLESVGSTIGNERRIAHESYWSGKAVKGDRCPADRVRSFRAHAFKVKGISGWQILHENDSVIGDLSNLQSVSRLANGWRGLWLFLSSDVVRSLSRTACSGPRLHAARCGKHQQTCCTGPLSWPPVYIRLLSDIILGPASRKCQKLYLVRKMFHRQ
jgi:hypothetical protein